MFRRFRYRTRIARYRRLTVDFMPLVLDLTEEDLLADLQYPASDAAAT